MSKKMQEQTPFFTKLKTYTEQEMIQHDVPGHKMGHIPNELLDVAGEMMFRLDVNAPRGLDNLNKPKSVLKEAAKLMSDAFGGEQAYFLTGGTTMGILSMIMSVCRAKDKIIMPRNVHKSAINALILSGADPVFIKPQIDQSLGIANHMPYDEVKNAVLEHPDAKAIFVINPTYFGVASALSDIVKLAHEHDMIVIADEAHGSHLKFHKELPLSAMKAGADMTSASLHKTAGSLTQSSVLITKGKRVDHRRLRSTINMLQSTSPSSLLLASLDVARKEMYLNGSKRLGEILKLAKFARAQINKIPGLFSPDKAYFLNQGAHHFDETKLIIKVSELGMSGFFAYKTLFDEYHIQVELAETHLILAVLSIGTRESDVLKLIEALKDMSDYYYHKPHKALKQTVKYTQPVSFSRPRDAYHAPKKYVRLKDAENEISAESIMIYPPGIPIVIPGEVITKQVLKDLSFYQKSGSVILSDTDRGYARVVDKENWHKWEE